jgi:hypothetical protein
LDRCEKHFKTINTGLLSQLKIAVLVSSPKKQWAKNLIRIYMRGLAIDREKATHVFGDHAHGVWKKISACLEKHMHVV